MIDSLGIVSFDHVEDIAEVHCPIANEKIFRFFDFNELDTKLAELKLLEQ